MLPERALYWPRERTLFVADTHWGKAATFRSLAIPIPTGSTSEDLERLGRTLDATGAERLTVLGDLLHAQEGRREETLAAVAGWLDQRRGLELLLVRGNHDRRAGDPPPDWGFRIVDEPYALPPFVLRHRPADALDGYVLAGHVHPKVLLRGPGADKIMAACFQVGPRRTVLPAFSSFAAGGLQPRVVGERYFVIADDEVLEALP